MSADPPSSKPRLSDWIVFLLSAVFFSTNLVFGRGISGEISPFIAAFLRWFLAGAALAPFVWQDRVASLAFIRNTPLLWLLLGFLGMGICGGGVYWSLHFTTASNATLIYTTSSLFIIIMERVVRGRPISPRQIAGMALAFSGVAVIVLKADPSALLHFRFNIGDFGILIAAIAWAAYCVLLPGEKTTGMAPLALFGVVCLAGALILAPFALLEWASGGKVPDTLIDWSCIAGIVIFASLGAFGCFQRSVRVLGASVAGMSLYLMPPISIILATIFLGEIFESYHIAGTVLVLGGVVLATAPRHSPA